MHNSVVLKFYFSGIELLRNMSPPISLIKKRLETTELLSLWSMMRLSWNEDKFLEKIPTKWIFILQIRKREFKHFYGIKWRERRFGKIDTYRTDWKQQRHIIPTQNLPGELE